MSIVSFARSAKGFLRRAISTGLGLGLLLASAATPAQAPVPRLFEPILAGVAGVAADVNPAQAEGLARIKARASSGAVSLVRINAAALESPTLSFNFTGDQSVNVRHKRSELVSQNTVVWVGQMEEVPGDATLVIQNGEVTGTVNNNGDVYRIEPVGDGVHAVVKVDISKLPRDDHPPSFKAVERATPAPAPAASAPGRRGSGAQGALGLLPDAADAFPGDGRPVVIDVLVAYTPAARNAVTNISATIALAVAEANQSYLNSGINIRLNLVDTLSVNYVEAGKTFETILADLVANNDVRTGRNAKGADMVAMIINKTDYCGLADAIKATADTAYALVHYDCATGYYSFAHELGHLMGARHDPTNDPSTSPYAYGHGYQYVSGSTAWRTIMGYNCSGGCPRLQYWSNPNVNYNGVPMGTAAVSNNARVLNETAATVAGFRTLAVTCNLFNDGYTSMAGPSDAMYFRTNGALCKPDGTATGTCRKWFGRCTTATGEAANFSVFDNGSTNQTANVDAVFVPQPQKACIPNGTATGNCRRWLGRALTVGGKPVSCYLFNDGTTSRIGPTAAIYARAPGQVCMPDGTANGACRKWFGLCTAR